ncbi:MULTISPECIES: hypothetical protein [Haloarcula]|uniref:hypothetical protein n=1 Tax=Haloarcula TaxID=2237 RepID=UPI0024C3DA71|nr:hypothetical protein [Halomicroarcula sp. YJ-61-S]
MLQSLVLDRLLMREGHVFWADAQGYATTTALARLAPSRRLLDRIHVARAFTAYQHYSIVQDLDRAVADHIQTETTRDPIETVRDRRIDGPDTDGERGHIEPTLVVAPALDTFYRANETLGDERAKTLQTRGLAALARYADGYDVPVLVTRSADDAFAAPIAQRANTRLQCELTDLGPRFVGEEFETTVYPVSDGAYQTTLAYWRDILAHRADQAGIEPSDTSTKDDEPSIGTADGGVTMRTDPVADALSESSAGGW